MTRNRDRGRRLDGILVLDKPLHIGSNAVLQHVRRLYGAARAGHTGTLDPMATGVLPVCFGEATKYSGELLDADKTYRAEITLGMTTETGDSEGEVLQRLPVSVDRDQVQRALRDFVGEIEQVPPMFSALKRNGVPLYVYARKGQSVPRAARKVTIRRIELLAMDDVRLSVAVTCSKGTYVRVLAEDLGAALGCGAYLSGLVRTQVGPFTIEGAYGVDRLGAMSPADRERVLLPVDALLGGYTQVVLESRDELLFHCGRTVVLPQDCAVGKVRVYGANRNLLGTGLSEPGGSLRPVRLIADVVPLPAQFPQ